MFLPLGDEPNEHHVRPWVNWTLIAANVAVFLAAKATTGGPVGYQAWVLDWGYVPLAPRIETLFSSMFMHADFLHLAGNMLFLWIFGDNVEGRLGHLGYLLAYLACGLAAVLLFHVLSPGSTIPLVGASGAIFGVEGFYFFSFARNRVRVVYWFFYLGSAMLPARLVIGISFATNLYMTLRMMGNTQSGGVAYAAHVGGFALGFLLAAAVRPAWDRAHPEEEAIWRFRR